MSWIGFSSTDRFLPHRKHIRSQFSPPDGLFQYQATTSVWFSSGDAPALFFGGIQCIIFEIQKKLLQKKLFIFAIFSMAFPFAGKLWNEWTGGCLANRINRLDFVMETENIHCEVRTEFLTFPYTIFVLESASTCTPVLEGSLCGFFLLGNLLRTWVRSLRALNTINVQCESHSVRPSCPLNYFIL
jgi:hypothetical protein